MSSPGPDQNNPYGSPPSSSGGQGGSSDPFAKGSGQPPPGAPGSYPGAPPAYPGQSGYPAQQGYPGQQGAPGQQGYPGQPGYPGQQGYPSAPGGYPQQGYPAQQPAYPGQPGGYPGQPGGYQPYPGGAYGTSTPGTPPVRPMTVTLAFWDWILLTVVSGVSLIFLLTNPVWDQAIAAGTSAAASSSVYIDASGLVSTIKIISVVFFLIFAALYLFFAFKMNAGRNWARIVLTVVGALSVLSGFTATTSVTVGTQTFTPATTVIFSWISAALALAAIILMFLPQSNAYFTASKAYRQQPQY